MTGKIDENTAFDSTDFRNLIPRFSPETRKENRALVDLIGNIGTTKPHRLEENIRAAAVELTQGDLVDLDRAASEITVQGERYPANAQRLINR